jgi:hypothetical protein
VSFPARFVFAADSCAAPALLVPPPVQLGRFSFCPFARLCASPDPARPCRSTKESVFCLSFCCSDPDAASFVSFCPNPVFRLVVLDSATKISFASCSCCAGTELQWWIWCLDLVLLALLLLGDSGVVEDYPSSFCLRLKLPGVVLAIDACVLLASGASVLFLSCRFKYSSFHNSCDVFVVISLSRI